MRWQMIVGGDGPHPLIQMRDAGEGGPNPLMYGGGEGGPNPLMYGGGEGGPHPLSGAYSQVSGSYAQVDRDTKIHQFAHLAVLEIHLFTAMHVHIFGDTGMVLTQGMSAQVWSGLIIDPPAGFEKRFIVRSMRFPKFTAAQQWLPVTTTYGNLLSAGPHLIYWNIAVFPGADTELTTNPGSLMVQAFYPGIFRHVKDAAEAKGQFIDPESADDSGKPKKS